MNGYRLMIDIGEREWTLAALHLACAAARAEETNILLLKMVPVRHPALLGSVASLMDFTLEDRVTLEDLVETAEDYGVPLAVQVFPCASYWHGLLDAAEQLDATAVITHTRASRFAYGARLRRWWLGRQLARQQRLLITLDDLTPSLVWTPSLTLQEDVARRLAHHHAPLA